MHITIYMYTEKAKFSKIQQLKINQYYRKLGPITSWETDAETVETVSDFIF